MTFSSSMATARCTVRTLTEEGVRFVVVAPGSRSAPMAYALAEAEAAGWLEVVVRIDERSAGFTALGLALGSGTPVAVLTTSGTAVGNLLPAVMEANHAAVPLIVLSADRPEELRGTGANQTTDQLDLFGSHVRFAADVQAGANPERAVRAGLSAATGRLPGIPAGPVQLNLAFRDPLTPALDGSDWQLLEPAEAPAEQPVDAQGGQENPSIGLEAGFQGRAVVVAGHGAGPSAELFARGLGLPLLAEPSSNARFGPNAVGPYRLLLDHFGSRIDRVVVFGRPTLSRPVAALLARADLPRALYLPRTAAWFEPGRRPEQQIMDWAELVAFAGTGEPGWLQQWQSAADAAENALDQVLAGQLSGPAVARGVWRYSGPDLVLGSSNPIRDADLAGRPLPHAAGTVHANRGLAGIDGTVATATGVALGGGRPTRALLGDLTLLHDVGSLLLGTGERTPNLQFVVLNDGGGGIFSTLEHGRLGSAAPYAHTVERLFGTPQRADFAALATGYGVRYQLAESMAELEAELGKPLAGRSLLEVRVSRSQLRPLHAAITEAVASAVAP